MCLSVFIYSGLSCTNMNACICCYSYYADSSPVLEPVQVGGPVVVDGLNYSTVACSDEGLRYLSQKLLSKRVSDVGRCLGVDESLIQRIEEDSTLDDQHKMHQLLNEWRCGKEPATWGMLAHSFRSLEDDSMMEELRQVAREDQNRGIIITLNGGTLMCVCVYYTCGGEPSLIPRPQKEWPGIHCTRFNVHALSI